jgi:RecJ-like exonuclease
VKPKAPPKMNPGDEAKPGTPGTGEDICPECNGKGKTARNEPCRNCGGTGKVVRGIGGA